MLLPTIAGRGLSKDTSVDQGEEAKRGDLPGERDTATARSKRRSSRLSNDVRTQAAASQSPGREDAVGSEPARPSRGSMRPRNSLPNAMAPPPMTTPRMTLSPAPPVQQTRGESAASRPGIDSSRSPSKRRPNQMQNQNLSQNSLDKTNPGGPDLAALSVGPSGSTALPAIGPQAEASPEERRGPRPSLAATSTMGFRQRTRHLSLSAAADSFAAAEGVVQNMARTGGFFPRSPQQPQGVLTGLEQPLAAAAVALSARPVLASASASRMDPIAGASECLSARPTQSTAARRRHTIQSEPGARGIPGHQPPPPPGHGHDAVGRFTADNMSVESWRELLKQAFLRHCGSLDNAFCWLDFNRRGQIGTIQWDSGLRVLNLEGPLREVKPSKLFMMICNKADHRISRADWRRFFQDKLPGDDEDDPEEGASAAEMAAAKSLKTLEKLREMKLRAEDNLEGSTRRTSADDIDASPRADELPNLDKILSMASVDGDGDSANRLLPEHRRCCGQLESTESDVCEAQQLQEDVAKLDFGSIKALAYIIKAKCGSLEKAFRWFAGANKQGHFTNVQWATGALVLHIDMEKLTGYSSRELFLMMGGRSGCVDRKQWFDFFEQALSTEDWESVNTVAESFRRNALKKLVLKWKQKALGALVQQPAAPALPEEHAEKAPGAQRTKGLGHLEPVNEEDEKAASRRQSARSAACRSPQPGDEMTSLSTSAAASKSRRSRRSLSTRGGSLQSAHSGHSAAADGDGPAVDSEKRAMSPPSPFKSQPLSRSPARQKTTKPTRQISEELAVAVDTGTSTTTLEDFVSRVRQELSELGPDEGVIYERLRRTERPALEEVVRELGLWSVSFPGSNVMVFREGPVAEDIRTRLKELQVGEMQRFESLEWAPRRFCRGVAEQSGFWVGPPEATADAAALSASAAATLEVFNLGGSISEFFSGVARTLLALAPGETIDFPPTLSKEQTEAVKKCGKDLGYPLETFAGKQGINISVGNLANFKTRVRQELEALRPGASVTYGAGPVEDTGAGDGALLSIHGPGLPMLVRHIVKQAATSVGQLSFSESFDKAGAAVMTIFRPEAVSDAESEASVTLSDAEAKEKCATLFDFYASGSGTSTSLILRKSDLYQFIEDVRNLNEVSKRQLDITLESAEQLFDDTLELQVDMGSRFSHGLTLDFFQVFLSKAAMQYGWTLHALLVTLLRFFSD